MPLVRAAALTLGLLALPMTARACSKIYMVGPTFGPREALMLATATADTTFAGPGAVEYRIAPGHNGPTGERRLYGQVVIVDSARGPGARGTGRVVLVPWDYGPDCTPTPWGGRSAWRRPGMHGLYRATLRDSAHWAGGLPTYDVFAPEFEPYMDRIGGAGAAAIGPRRTGSLTPVELFNASANFAESPDSASMMKYIAWARANPSISERDPIHRSAWYAAYVVRNNILKAIDLPLRGTYRVTATLGADSVVFFARTDSTATSAWDHMPGRPSRTTGDRLSIEPIDGVVLLVTLGADLLSLPKNYMRQSYVYLPVRPDTVQDGATTWVGQLQPDMPGIVFPDSPFASRFKRAEGVVPATFTLEANGVATFAHRSVLADGRVLELRAVRVSNKIGRW